MSRWIAVNFTKPLNGDDAYCFVENEGIFLTNYTDGIFNCGTHNFDCNQVQYWMPVKNIDKYRIPLPPDYVLKNSIKEELTIDKKQNTFDFTYTTTM